MKNVCVNYEDSNQKFFSMKEPNAKKKIYNTIQKAHKKDLTSIEYYNRNKDFYQNSNTPEKDINPDKRLKSENLALDCSSNLSLGNYKEADRLQSPDGRKIIDINFVPNTNLKSNF